ncbi:hypothetical protein BASA81_012409 [Batrachochytrium salamandrivorans]|nr:hypothetical protein BASA81_012409 [Batrachochytrium salamandrivorans]
MSVFNTCFRPKSKPMALGSPEVTTMQSQRQSQSHQDEDRPSFSTDSNFIAPSVLHDLHAKFKNAPTRRELINEAEKMYCAENFRFIAAVLDWEATPGDGPLKAMAAYKIIATFIENGSRYEINLSPKTRDLLLVYKLKKKRTDRSLFETAKLEIVRDILQNPSMKSLLFNIGSGSGSSLGVKLKPSRQSLL